MASTISTFLVWILTALLLVLIARLYKGKTIVEFIIYIMAFPATLGYLVGVSETAGIKMGKALVAAVVAGLACLLVKAALTESLLGVLRISSA